MAAGSAGDGGLYGAGVSLGGRSVGDGIADAATRFVFASSSSFFSSG